MPTGIEVFVGSYHPFEVKDPVNICRNFSLFNKRHHALQDARHRLGFKVSTLGPQGSAIHAQAFFHHERQIDSGSRAALNGNGHQGAIYRQHPQMLFKVGATHHIKNVIRSPTPGCLSNNFFKTLLAIVDSVRTQSAGKIAFSADPAVVKTCTPNALHS